MPTLPQATRSAGPGQYVYALCIFAFGFIYFFGNHSLQGLVPLSGSAGFQVFCGILFGIILVTFSILLLSKKYAGIASFLLGVFLLLLMLFIHLPLIIRQPSNGGTWTAAMEMTCLFCGAFVLADRLQPVQVSNFHRHRLFRRAGFIATLLFATCLIGFGILHFIYAEYIATLIPDWIPFHLFWSYFILVCFVGCGISLFTGIAQRRSMLALSVMFFLWVIVLHFPRAFSKKTAEPEWTSLFVALAMGSIALLLSKPAGNRGSASAKWAHTAILSIPLLLFSFPSTAQETYIGKPAEKLASFPFTTLTGGVILVKVQLEGAPDTLSFIMDTGSAGISIDSLTCLRLHLPTEPSDIMVLGIGGIRNVRFVRLRTLHMGVLTVDSLNLHVSDYSVLSSVYGEKIDGIMGYSFLSRYIVRIDYDDQVVTVYNHGYLRYPKGGYLLHPSLVNLPVQPASLKEAFESNSRFYFDTGAGLCLLLTTDYLKDSAIFYKNKKPLPTQAQGLGGKANMEITTLRELKIGPYHFKNIPTHIFSDDYNVMSYPSLAGLIGNDILRRFNLYLNYEKKCFYLVPNTHFRDPFDYSYTGLGLYWEDNGEITVGDIQKDSPAAEAGFEVGDVVVAVNKNISHDLQAYKVMMQNVGERLRFDIIRIQTPLVLNMKVKSIL